MERVQRTAWLCITGALDTSPTDALNTILNLPPIDIYMEYLAAKSAARLTALGHFKIRPWEHSSIGRHCSDKTDYMTPGLHLGRIPKCTLERDGWRKDATPSIYLQMALKRLMVQALGFSSMNWTSENLTSCLTTARSFELSYLWCGRRLNTQRLARRSTR